MYPRKCSTPVVCKCSKHCAEVARTYGTGCVLAALMEHCYHTPFVRKDLTDESICVFLLPASTIQSVQHR